MQHRLDGKIAAVTGASRGIGREIARALHERGARVALLARPSADLRAAALELGEGAEAFAADLARPGDVQQAFAAIQARLGGVDVLINNAAICRPYLLEVASYEDIATDVAISLLGPIYCARAALPMLKASAGADIINVSSEAVRLPVPHLTIYAASKGGLEVFSAGLRAELRPHAIRVTTLRLGNIAGTGIRRGWNEQNAGAFFVAMQSTGAAIEVGAGGSPQSVALAVTNLLSLPRDVNVDLVELRSI